MVREMGMKNAQFDQIRYTENVGQTASLDNSVCYRMPSGVFSENCVALGGIIREPATRQDVDQTGLEHWHP